jgi:hypothetical protein
MHTFNGERVFKVLYETHCAPGHISRDAQSSAEPWRVLKLLINLSSVEVGKGIFFALA